MATSHGSQAVVVGAGMGGLSAAPALSSHFDHVSVLERDSLPELPATRAGTPQCRHGHGLLTGGLFAGLKSVLDTPWGAIVAQDFQFPQTRGEPPANFEAMRRFGVGLLRLAAEDAATHRLWQEVAHLIRPATVYQEPDFVARVMARSTA